MTVSLTKPAIGAVDVAGDLNQNWTDVEDALNDVVSVAGLFGDGSDGAAVINSNTSLSRDMFYTTLAIRSSAVLTTNGYRIYAQTSVTVDSGCTVRNNGSNGAVGAGGPGGVGNTLGSGGNGGFGFNGSSTFGSYGGNGGTGTFGGGTAFDPTSGNAGIRIAPQLFTGLAINAGNDSGLRGGAGGGGGSGGGGGGGGVVLIATPTLVNEGTIEAKGGNGSGTGGGGGGGVLLLIYGQKSGGGSTSVAAGTGGTGAQSGTAFEITP